MYPSRRLRLDVASVASEILVSIVQCLFRIAPLLLAGLLMAGCAPSHYSKGISSFAAAAPALDKVDASYTAVNNVHIFEEQTELVAQYDTSGYRPGQIKAVISPEELETRTQAVRCCAGTLRRSGTWRQGNRPKLRSGVSRRRRWPLYPTAAAAASGKMTPQQMGLILSGLDTALHLRPE